MLTRCSTQAAWHFLYFLHFREAGLKKSSPHEVLSFSTRAWQTTAATARVVPDFSATRWRQTAATVVTTTIVIADFAARVRWQATTTLLAASFRR